MPARNFLGDELDSSRLRCVEPCEIEAKERGDVACELGLRNNIRERDGTPRFCQWRPWRKIRGCGCLPAGFFSGIYKPIHLSQAGRRGEEQYGINS